MKQEIINKLNLLNENQLLFLIRIINRMLG